MELLKKISKSKNGENVPHLEITEVVLVHCNMVNNDYQQDSRVLYTFVPNKSFGSLLDISPSNHIFLKTFNSEYVEIKVWFTDQNSKPLEIQDRTNLTMVIKQCWMQFHCIKMRYSIEPKDKWKDMDSCLFLEVWEISMERNLLIQQWNLLQML